MMATAIVAMVASIVLEMVATAVVAMMATGVAAMVATAVVHGNDANCSGGDNGISVVAMMATAVVAMMATRDAAECTLPDVALINVKASNRSRSYHYQRIYLPSTLPSVRGNNIAKYSWQQLCQVFVTTNLHIQYLFSEINIGYVNLFINKCFCLFLPKSKIRVIDPNFSHFII